jgi:hypothetical protein
MWDEAVETIGMALTLTPTVAADVAGSVLHQIVSLQLRASRLEQIVASLREQLAVVVQNTEAAFATSAPELGPTIQSLRQDLSRRGTPVDVQKLIQTICTVISAIIAVLVAFGTLPLKAARMSQASDPSVNTEHKSAGDPVPQSWPYSTTVDQYDSKANQHNVPRETENACSDSEIDRESKLRGGPNPR